MTESTENKFDFEQAIKKLDPAGNIDSIEQLGDQVQHVWSLAQLVKADTSYQDIDKVVVSGMGGSIIGTHVIQTVFKEELQVPIIACSDYKLPDYVNEKTLFVASSYSGNTEETLAAAQEAQEKGAKIIGISSGGKLEQFLQKNHYPGLIFEPKHNPSNSPRMGLGYSIFGQIALLSKFGVLKISDQDYQQVLDAVAQAQTENNRHVAADKNPAKILAFNLIGQIPIITAAEHLEGVSHVMANQLNENSKTYSEFRVIPEIHHHLMEGLQFPHSNDRTLAFFLVESDLYLEKNQLRMKLTAEVVNKNQVESLSHQLQAKTKLAQAFELLVLGSYTSYYLALLNNQDPTPNPWVDWIKAQLK